MYRNPFSSLFQTMAVQPILVKKVPKAGSKVAFQISGQASMWVKVVKLTKKTSARITEYVVVAGCRSALKKAVFAVEKCAGTLSKKLT